MEKLLRTAPMQLPLVQQRQADLLKACGFPCAPAGTHEFYGQQVPMFRPVGIQKPAAAEVIGYGGAAFGGKSYGGLILGRIAAELIPGVQIAFFRRTYAELDGPGAAIQKSYEIFTNAAKDRDGGKEWQWDNGSGFYFRHCQRESDVYNYQSQQIDILIIDEATHFTWKMIDYLLTRNRANVGSLSGFTPFALLFANPGNIGHVWYSQIFDVEKNQEQVKEIVNPNGKPAKTIFIPAFLEDNQIGVARDPGYEGRLMQRDPSIAKALRWGDWSIFAGQMFPTWNRDRISIKPFEIPKYWARWRAVDYGLNHPFAAGWFTQDPTTERIFIYRAILEPGLTDTQQARLIRTQTPADEHILRTYASPDMWARKTVGTRIFTSVDEYRDEGVTLTKADNDRLNGVRKIHRLLVDAMDGKPRIQVFENYYDVFVVMPTLVRSELRPEDVEKVDGDDAFDMLKYGLTHLELPAGDQDEEAKKRRTEHPARGVKGI